MAQVFEDQWSNVRLTRPSSHWKKESNQHPKLLEIEKETVRDVARGDKQHLR